YTELTNAIGAASESARHNLLASLDATEILTFLDQRQGLVRASVRFERPLINIQVDSKSQPKQEGEIAQCFGYSAVVYFDAQSKVTRLEFPKEYSTMAGNFVKAIITLQQYSDHPSSSGRDLSTRSE